MANDVSPLAQTVEAILQGLYLVIHEDDGGAIDKPVGRLLLRTIAVTLAEAAEAAEPMQAGEQRTIAESALAGAFAIANKRPQDRQIPRLYQEDFGRRIQVALDVLLGVPRS